MKFFLIFLVIFFYSCTNFKPLYKEKEFLSNNFKEVAVVTDKKKMSLSIKKNLLRRLPPIKNEISYILKIESQVESTSTATDTKRKTSGYEIKTSSKVYLYKREKKYDREVLMFEENSVGLFNFSPNQVLSTLAARNRVLENSSNDLSEVILYRLMTYFSEKYNDN